MKLLFTFVLLLLPQVALGQVVDRQCSRLLDDERATLTELIRERDDIRKTLKLPAGKTPVDEVGDCKARRSSVAGAMARVNAELTKLRERFEAHKQEEQGRAFQRAQREAEAASVGELAKLRREVNELKKDRRRGASAQQPAPPAFDIPTVQLGVVMTALGGAFAISSILNVLTGAGLFAVGALALGGVDSVALYGGIAVGTAVLQAGLGALLLYFGADRLAAGLGAVE